MNNKTKIWVGVGAYLLTSITPALGLSDSSSGTLAKTLFSESAQAAEAPQIAQAQPGAKDGTAKPAAGGEGGEGGEGGGAVNPDPQKLSGMALVNALRGGGHIVFFRHAQTDKDYADQAGANLKLGDCSTQRTLSQAGWNQAKAIGQAFRSLRIPVGQVYSSEYCRAWQTADLAFGKYKKTAALNFLPFEEYTAAQMDQMKAAIMPLLTAVPRARTNTVVVGHDDVFKSATGIYPEPQGVAYVLKPIGDGTFEVLARIPAEAWTQMPR